MKNFNKISMGAALLITSCTPVAKNVDKSEATKATTSLTNPIVIPTEAPGIEPLIPDTSNNQKVKISSFNTLHLSKRDSERLPKLKGSEFALTKEGMSELLSKGSLDLTLSSELNDAVLVLTLSVTNDEELKKESEILKPVLSLLEKDKWKLSLLEETVSEIEKEKILEHAKKIESARLYLITKSALEKSIELDIE
jgi:hypothetical protein